MTYQLSSRDILLSSLILIGLLVLYLSSVQEKHMGRHGFPCYCKKCEHTLINDAMNGDKTAMGKLQEATVSYASDTYDVLYASPYFTLLILVLIGGGVYVYSQSQQRQ